MPLCRMPRTARRNTERSSLALWRLIVINFRSSNLGSRQVSIPRKLNNVIQMCLRSDCARAFNCSRLG